MNNDCYPNKKKMYFNVIKVEKTGSESESKVEKAWFLLKITNKNVQKKISIQKLAGQ